MMRQLELFPAMPSGRCPLCRSRAPRLDECQQCVLRRAAVLAARPYPVERASDLAARRVLIAEAARRAEKARAEAERIERLRKLGPRAVRVAVVACGKTKRAGRHLARDLYTGALFRASLAHAERTADEVLIASALHGLVRPTDEIDAYALSLDSFSKRERASWGVRVVSALALLYPGIAVDLTIYAGSTYADAIERGLWFRPTWCRVELRGGVRRPLGRLPLGKRLAWLRSERASTTPPPDARRCARRLCFTVLPHNAPDGAACAACARKERREAIAAQKREAFYAAEAAREEQAERRVTARAAREAEKHTRRDGARRRTCAARAGCDSYESAALSGSGDDRPQHTESLHSAFSSDLLP